MGCNNYIVQLEQRIIFRRGFRVKHVQCCACNFPIDESLVEISLIQHRASSKIADIGGLFHGPELSSFHHASGLIGEGQMERDKIRNPQAVFQLVHFLDALCFHNIGGDISIIGEYIHTKNSSLLSNTFADTTKTDKQKAFVLHITGKVGVAITPISHTDILVSSQQILSTCKDKQHCVFADGGIVSIRDIEGHYSVFGCGDYVYIVQADAG